MTLGAESCRIDVRLRARRAIALDGIAVADRVGLEGKGRNTMNSSTRNIDKGAQAIGVDERRLPDNRLQLKVVNIRLTLSLISASGRPAITSFAATSVLTPAEKSTQHSDDTRFISDAN